MALAAGDISIINLALMRIGSTVPMVAEADTTNEARVANLLYTRCRDYVLTAYPWEFATKRAALAGQATSTSTLWAYSYTYPADCLKARRVLGAAASPRRDEPIPFQVLNTGSAIVILTNEATASLEYTVSVTDPTLFDPVYESALGYYLASELALGLRAKPETAKGALDAFAQIIQAQNQPGAREGLPEASISYTDGSAALTDVAVFNMALAKLGHTRHISAFTEPVDEARLGAILYYKARDYVLSDFPWEFATRRELLAGSAASTDLLWGYSYTYPSGCLRVRAVLGVGSTPDRYEPKPFMVGNSAVGTKKIYTNEASASVEYTIQATDPTLFSAAFVEALTYYLASLLAGPLKVDPNLGKGMLEAYHAIRKAQENPATHEGMAQTQYSYTDGTSSTQLIICNTALGLLGHRHHIASLTENTDAARMCAMFYGRAVNSTLEAFPWNFASKYVALVEHASIEPPTNWSLAYTLPTDCAVARELVYPGNRTPRADMRIPFEIGWATGTIRLLYTDLEDAELHYTTSTVSETLYDNLFKDALAWRLAADIAPGLGLDPKMSMWAHSMFNAALSTAQARSHNEGFEGPDPDCEFISVRS